MPQFITDDMDWVAIPDIVVSDVAYCYTGLRDSQGHRILRRVSRPIGFLANTHEPFIYLSDSQDQPEVTQDEIHESE